VEGKFHNRSEFEGDPVFHPQPPDVFLPGVEGKFFVLLFLFGQFPKFTPALVREIDQNKDEQDNRKHRQFNEAEGGNRRAREEGNPEDTSGELGAEAGPHCGARIETQHEAKDAPQQRVGPW